MRRLMIGALVIGTIGLSPVRAQQRQDRAGAPPEQGQARGGGARGQRGPAAPPTEQPFEVVKMDPAIDAIIDSKAKLETVAEHIGLSEGPLWIQEGRSGYLLFSDVAANVIYKWTPTDKKLSVFLERAGYTGNDVLNVGQQTTSGGRVAIILIGSNGLALDPQGRIVICAMTDRTIVRLEKDGTRTVLADKFEGKRFNGPNDVVVKSNGAIYFSDSVNGLRGGPVGPDRQLPFNGFFLIKDGKPTYLGGDREPGGGAANGITLSPDEKYLYVSAGRTVRRYDVQPDDTVANGHVFISDAGSDGMKVDRKGNLYTTGGGAGGRAQVRITSPEGKQIGALLMPVELQEPRPRICATNVAFGDADNKGLYITTCSNVYRVQLKAPGVIRTGPQNN
jgi:gluconolactonase